VTPEPGAWTTLNDDRLKVLDLADAGSTDAPTLDPGAIALLDGRLLIGTGTTPLELRRVQPAGRTAMDAADWWRGAARTSGVVR
jgi:methionyl-tRNA formyltransferase